jgi:hypothetical protein
MARKNISPQVQARVRQAAGGQCAYCRSNQDYIPVTFEIDHIIPYSISHDHSETNLCLTCPTCNRYKSDQVSGIDPQTGQTVALFNPCQQVWPEHFRWSSDGLTIIGITPTGRVTVLALRLNTIPYVLAARRNWIRAGWHPPDD